MIPTPKLNAKENRQRIRMEMLNRPKDDGQAVGDAKSAAQKRYDEQEDAKVIRHRRRQSWMPTIRHASGPSANFYSVCHPIISSQGDL
jgi:hypothetical protein